MTMMTQRHQCCRGAPFHNLRCRPLPLPLLPLTQGYGHCEAMAAVEKATVAKRAELLRQRHREALLEQVMVPDCLYDYHYHLR